MPRKDPPKRILLVDDDLDILVVTRTALEVIGEFVTDSCSSAVEALAYVAEFLPDLILVDVMMPDLDGISFVQELKKRPRFAEIPVIFMTARTQAEDIEGYMIEGVLDVISKPFDPEELVQKLNGVWKVAHEPSAEAGDELSQKLEVLQKLYIGQLPAKIHEIKTLWALIDQGGQGPETVRKFHRLIHSMTGTGATFGFNTLSIMARVLENFLRPLVDTHSLPDASQRAEVTRIIGLLTAAAENPELEVPIPGPKLALVPTERRSEKSVYLFEENDEERTELVRQLGFFGYQVEGFSRTDTLEEAMEIQLPSVLVMNTRQGNWPLAGVQASGRWHERYRDRLVQVFLSDTEDLETHLQALRAGGKAFFSKPVDLGDLVDKIDSLTGHHLDEPYRILIVEDDPQLASYYQLILEREGIECLVVDNALQVLGPIRSFRPDLILLDIYMGSCSGLELAAMLRQRESLLGIAIVFLSTEAAQETQSAGIALGAEDYLTKPIQASHLVSVLIPRLQRSRVLRTIMDTDGLTGLLNHTKTKEHLESQWRQSQMLSKATFVYAMIDIDHFKRVNDSYGHATGDRILKSLARLLKQRLRTGDLIGRYGGEEFAVIMPDTSREEARTVLEEIRESFGSVNHRFGDKEFRVTFSCGIAAWPQHSQVVELSDAADAALYQAKKSGRNLVVVAGAESEAESSEMSNEEGGMQG